jgi:hypothetical protein
MFLPKHGYHFTIPLTRGKQAIVDERDWKSLRQHRWHAIEVRGGMWYAARNGRRKQGKRSTYRYMHRELLGLPAGDRRQIDHANHNELDNRRSNITICTPRQNMANLRTHGEHGVGICQAGKRFSARAKVGKRLEHLGTFDTPEEARTARERRLHELGKE